MLEVVIAAGAGPAPTQEPRPSISLIRFQTFVILVGGLLLAAATPEWLRENTCRLGAARRTRPRRRFVHERLRRSSADGGPWKAGVATRHSQNFRPTRTCSDQIEHRGSDRRRALWINGKTAVRLAHADWSESSWRMASSGRDRTGVGRAARSGDRARQLSRRFRANTW